MTIAAVCLGFVLDAMIGDPQGWWHPICAIGSLISKSERFLRRIFPKTPRGEVFAGMLLWFLVCAVSFAVPFVLLYLAGMVHPWLRVALETVMCCQIFARHSLREAAMQVYERLMVKDLDGARTCVGYIVGRDTEALTAEGVTKAAVETVAENTSDGVIAPMLFLMLGGAPLGFLYKAVNTMDSMVGYKNEKYLYFGRFAAKMDDVFNWIPARLSALCMIAGAGIVGMDMRGAFRIWRRDRRNHASPNSAQTESVCAGALQVQLAGTAFYFGKRYEKPTIGDATRPIAPQDITQACRLMTAGSVIALVLLAVIFTVIFMWK